MIHRRHLFRKHFRDAASSPITAEPHGDRHTGKREHLQRRTGPSSLETSE